MKTMLLLGADRIARQALACAELHDPGLIVAIDRSTSLKRVARLIWRRRLSLALVGKMFLCELTREKTPSVRPATLAVRTNRELLALIRQHRPDRIILFRAGLVINREVIEEGVPLLNIHCAKIPDYGGLGSIARALKDGALAQCATLHQVTKTIDTGIVFDEEPYQLDSEKSYCHNENIAYEAGMRMLLRTVSAGKA